MEKGERIHLVDLSLDDLKKEMAIFFDLPIERVDILFTNQIERYMSIEQTEQLGTNLAERRWELIEQPTGDDQMIAIIRGENKKGGLKKREYSIILDKTGRKFNPTTQQMEPYYSLCLMKRRH